MGGIVGSGRVFGKGHSLLKQFVVKQSCTERKAKQRSHVPPKPPFDVPVWVVMIPNRHVLCGGMAFSIPTEEMR